MNHQTRLSPKTATLFTIALAAGATPLAAQQEFAVGQTVTAYTPHFFMAVLGGVILAIGFQILLTSLSVASGISLVGNIEKKFDGRSSRKEDDSSGDEHDEEGTSPIVKISNAIGIWTVITASVSLFFASLLAVRLTLVGTVWMGITLGLIIWAAFFATMAYLEIRSVSTLIGGVISAAFSGMRASFASAKNVFVGSPEDKIMKSATDVASAVRQELTESFETSGLVEKLDEYVERLRPQPIDYEQVKADLTEILGHVKLEEKTDLKEGHLDRQTFVRIAQKEQPHLKKQDIDKLGDMYEEISSTMRKDAPGSEKVGEMVQKFSGDKEEAARYQAKVEEYLRKTGRDEIDPERIKQDIDQMFVDPKSAPEIVMNRLNAIDRDTLVAVLAQRDGVGSEKAEKIVGYVEKAIQFVREKVTGAERSMEEKGASASAALSQKGHQLGGIPGRVEDRIREYMASIGRPEFNYDRIRLDVERMFHDPKATPKILRARMKLYNRESLIALLSSKENVSEADAERMVSKVEEAKENVIRRAEELENEVRRRLREAKEMALHEAENVRKASAAAAWWMVGTAVVSGAFSAFGAALAITL